MKKYLFLFLILGLFFSVRAAQADFGYWGSATGQTAGAIQEVPEGYALTAIGYGSDDHKCWLYIKTAPVSYDGSINFTQSDSSWRGTPCGNGGGDDNPEPNIDLSGTNQVVTGWTWGADTSGGKPGSGSSPADECYFQQYMNLRTKEQAGFGGDYDGTCNDRGYSGSWLKAIAYAPSGNVIIAIKISLADDANANHLSVTAREITPVALLDAYVGNDPTRKTIDLTYDKSNGQTSFSPGNSVTVENIGQSGSTLNWNSDPFYNSQTVSITGEFLNSDKNSGTISTGITDIANLVAQGLSPTITNGTYANAATVRFTGADNAGEASIDVNLIVTGGERGTGTFPERVDMVDMKVKIGTSEPTDGPLTIPYNQNTIISWGAVGGVEPNYSNCIATGDWSGSQPVTGSFVTPTQPAINHSVTYTITCTTTVTVSTSDSIVINYTASSQPSSTSCSVTVNPSSILVGQSATWFASSTTDGNSGGKRFYWYGTDNGSTITPVYGGLTNIASIYTYNQTGTYTRYIKIQDNPDVTPSCTSSTVTLAVNTQQPSGSLSCSAPGDTSSPYTTRATVGNGQIGYNYNWGGTGACNITGREVNDGSGGSGHWIDLNCNEGNHIFGVTEAATGRSAQCAFNACPPEGCEPPAPDPGPLTAATDGRYENVDCGLGNDEEGNPIYCQVLRGSWADSLSGDAPLNNVDFLYKFNRSWIFEYPDRIEFDCTNDGSSEYTVRYDSQNYNWSQIPALNICNYSNPGTYTAKATVYKREGGSPLSDTATIIVNKKVDFTFDSTWEIPKGTSRYDAKGTKYDYNNDNKMSAEDVTLLQQYAVSRNCPSGKLCDFNESSGFNIGDVLAYQNYLKTLSIPLNYLGARAKIKLASSSGANVIIGNIPSGFSVNPTTVNIPTNGSGNTFLSVPSNLPSGTRVITLNGTDSPITNSDPSPLTLNVGLNNPPTVTGPGGSGGPQVIEPNYCTSGPAATVVWAYSDPDGDPQVFYQVQIDDEGSSFSNCEDADPNTICEVDSGKISSGGTSYSSGQGKLQFNLTYKARVKAWDSKGGESAWSVSNSWKTPKHAYPQPNFTWTPLNPSPNQPAQFTDQTVFFDGSGGGQRGWSWNFGDNGSSTVQNPAHTYSTAGNFTTNLTSTDKDGYACATSPGQTINVKTRIPTWKEVPPKP